MSVFKGNVIKNEPVLIQGLVQAVIGLLLAFGIDLSNEQVGAIMAVTAVILAVITRALVTPDTKEPPQGVPPVAPPMYPESGS